MATLFFLVREAFINLRRHGMMTAAAVSTLAAALVLCGGFVLGASRVVAIARRQVDSFEMRVFCRAESSPTALAEIRSRLVALGGVRKVEFIPREKAFEEQARGLPIDTEGVPNLFPHTYVVRFDAPESARRNAEQVRAWHGDVEGVDVRERELEMALRIAGFLGRIGIFGGGALLAGALLVVMNTIRLSVHARHREIQIMRIVGATSAFIRLPMVIEGILHGIGAGLVATGLLWLADRGMRLLAADIPLLTVGADPFDPAAVALGLVGAGVAVGAAGSMLALRRHLRIR